MSDIHTLRKILNSPHLDEKPNEHLRSPHWPALEKQHIAEHPTCAGCGGTEDLEVHHEFPFHLFPQFELDPTKLITLCGKPGTNCHYRLGHNSDSWSDYNPEVVADAAAELKRLQKRRKECKGETPEPDKGKKK